MFPAGSQNQRPLPPSPSRRILNLHFNHCGCYITQPQRTRNNQLVIAPPKPSTPWDFYVKIRRNSMARPRDYATVTTQCASPTPPPRWSGQSVGAIGWFPLQGGGVAVTVRGNCIACHTTQGTTYVALVGQESRSGIGILSGRWSRTRMMMAMVRERGVITREQ